MQVFEINILRKSGDVWPVMIEISPPDLFLSVRLEGVLRLGLDELNIQPTLQAYGIQLGKALFQERIRFDIEQHALLMDRSACCSMSKRRISSHSIGSDCVCRS